MAGHSFDTKAEHNRLSYLFEETQDVSLIGEYFAWNLGTRVTEHIHQDTIGHFAYQEVDGQWTANGQTLFNILNPPQELIDQIENYQPVSDQFKNGLHAVEHGMIGDKSVKQAVFVSPITNDSMGQYSVIYYFTRDEFDPSKINVNPITFRGSDLELQKVLQTLNKETPSLEGILSFNTPAFVRSENVISKMDLFDAIRKTLEPTANRETKEYLARLESDLTLYEELETLQALRIEYLKELTLEYLKEGLKDGTFFQRLRDLADGAPDLAEWLSRQEKLDPLFYEKGVKAPIFEVRIEETIQNEMLPLFVIGWGDVARKEAAKAAGVEKGELLPPPKYLEPYFKTKETIEFRRQDSIMAPLQRVAQDLYRAIVPENLLQPYPLSRRPQDEVPTWLRENEDLLRRARHQAFLESLITKRANSHVVFNSSKSDLKVASEIGNRLFTKSNTQVVTIPTSSIPIDIRTATIASMIKPVNVERPEPTFSSYSPFNHTVRTSNERSNPQKPSSFNPQHKNSSIFVKRRETTRRARIQTGIRRLTSKRQTQKVKARHKEHSQGVQIKEIKGREFLAIQIKLPRFLVRLLRKAREILTSKPKYSAFYARQFLKGIFSPNHVMNSLNRHRAFTFIEKIQRSFAGFRFEIKLPFFKQRESMKTFSIKADRKTNNNVREFIGKIKSQLAYNIPQRELIPVESALALANKQAATFRHNLDQNQKKPLPIKPLSISNRRSFPIQSTFEPLVLKAIMESRSNIRISTTRNIGKEEVARTRNERDYETRNILTKLLTNYTDLRSSNLLKPLSDAKLAEKKLEVLTMLQLEAKSREIDFFEFLSQIKVKSFKKSKYYLESLIIALMEALGISDLDQIEILRTLGVTENDARQISILLKQTLELSRNQPLISSS